MSQTLARRQAQSPRLTTRPTTTVLMSNETERKVHSSNASSEIHSTLLSNSETGDLVHSIQSWSSEDSAVDITLPLNSHNIALNDPSALTCAHQCGNEDEDSGPMSTDDECDGGRRNENITGNKRRRDPHEFPEKAVHITDRKRNTPNFRPGSKAVEQTDEEAVESTIQIESGLLDEIRVHRGPLTCEEKRGAGSAGSHTGNTVTTPHGEQYDSQNFTGNGINQRSTDEIKSEEGKILSTPNKLQLNDEQDGSQHQQQQRKYGFSSHAVYSEVGLNTNDRLKEQDGRGNTCKVSRNHNETTKGHGKRNTWVSSDQESVSPCTTGSDTLNYDMAAPPVSNCSSSARQEMLSTDQVDPAIGSSVKNTLNPCVSTLYSDAVYCKEDCGRPLDCPVNMEGCISPMLAAAAVAALSGGRFPSASITSQFNPVFTSASANAFALHLNEFNMRAGELGLSGSTRSNSDRSQLRVDSEQESLLSPMHAMYNTSRLLFGEISNNRLQTNTPSPPPLSASTSPRIRDVSKSNEFYDSMAQGDEEDEEDEEEEEAEDLGSVDQETTEAEALGKTGSGQHWTFEEQFKQLYILSDDPKRKEFLDELFAYMQRRGTPVNRIPIMAKQVLDLYELFHLVVARGGLVEVINKKLWREITKGLSLPSSITSAAFTLRTQYMKYLYPYECDTLGLSSPSELQAAIDGNRREARRSSYSFDYSLMVNPTGMNRAMSPSGAINSQSSNALINPTLSMATMLSNSRLASSASVPSGDGSPDMPSSIPQLTGVTLPFGAGTLGLTTQAVHPLMGFPTGAGSALSIPPSSSGAAHQLPSVSNHLFPSHFIHPMASATGFSFGSSGSLQQFVPGGAEESAVGSSSHSSNCLFPGIPGSLAAAAATLFSAGFPALPGAFVTGNLQTSTKDEQASGSGISRRTSPAGQNRLCGSTSPVTGKQNQLAHSGFGTYRGLCGQQRVISRSPSPLNLAANEEDMGRHCNRDNARQNSESPLEYGSVDKQEKREPEGRRTTSSPDSTRRNNKQSEELSNQIRAESRDIITRLGSINSSTTGAEESKWVYPGLGATGTQRSRFMFEGDGEAAFKESNSGNNSMTQFWASSSGGIPNGVPPNDDNGSSMANYPSNAANHSISEHVTNRGSSGSTSSIKRPVSGLSTGNRYEAPAAKNPRMTGPVASGFETTTKRSVLGTSQTRKSAVLLPEGRRATETMQGSTSGKDNSSNNVGSSGMQFSMLQNFRIQAQSGGAVGLPQNAMVVTMEMGNVLYQGVLFGQTRR